MSSESKFWPLKKKTDNYEELKINRNHIVTAVDQYLRSLKMISRDADTTNIQFSDLFGKSHDEFVNLKIYYEGGV